MNNIVTGRITDDLLEEVDDLAARMGVTRAWIIRESLKGMIPLWNKHLDKQERLELDALYED